MYSRSLESSITELLEAFRIVYLTGPRQAGKTTLVRKVADRLGMTYLTLDDQAVYASASEDPHGFILSQAERRIVLDEFQYVPPLIPAIKAASDRLPQDVRGKFLLTGSADIFRSARVQEALPGHMARLELYPLSVGELTGRSGNLIDDLLAGDFAARSLAPMTRLQLGQWILDGGYPEIQGMRPRVRRVWFQSYLEGRLFKDFETLYTARGDYHSRLKALAPYLAGLCGNLLKYANVANDLEMDDKLVKSYIEILELMFIVRRLPGWLRNRARRQAVRMPKLHFVDTALACHLLGLRTTEQLIGSNHFGGLLESLLFMECCKQAAWAEQDVELYHFRDNAQNEVDLVLEQPDGGIVGIEVKAAAGVDTRDFKGLRKLAEAAGQRFRHGIVFYSGAEVLPFGRDGQRLYALPLRMLCGDEHGK